MTCLIKPMCCLCFTFMAFVLGNARTTLSADYPDGLVSISRGGGILSIVDSELFFKTSPGSAFPHREYIATHNADTVIRSWSFTLQPEHGYLKIYFIEQIEGMKDDFAKCHGYYLTGDYSTDPPRVILTRQPEKYSKWELRPIEGAIKYRGNWIIDRNIRNINDKSKDAWLNWLENGFKKIESGRGSVVLLRAPILSFDKPETFELARYHGDSGK